MSNQSLLISIVTYNSKHIFEVLDQLKQEFSGDDSIKVVIFDNNSDKDYQSKLKTYTDFCDCHFHASNEGFGFGHNYNLLTADAEYFLVLNPDVILTQENLDKLLSEIKRREDCGIIVPKVLNADGTTQHLIRNQVSVWDYFLRFVPFRFIKTLFDKRLARYECRDLSDTEIVPVRIGSGCCMLLKAKAFKEVEGFDSRYFMYFEDYDLCIKLGQQDYQVVYNPLATIIHFYGKEAHKSFKLFKIFMLSMIKFFNKWGWRFF